MASNFALCRCRCQRWQINEIDSIAMTPRRHDADDDDDRYGGDCIYLLQFSWKLE